MIGCSATQESAAPYSLTPSLPTKKNEPRREEMIAVNSLYLNSVSHLKLQWKLVHRCVTPTKKIFKEIGVPPCIICDSAPNQIQGEARKLCNLCSCTIKSLEKGTPSSNRAECCVGLVKSNVKKNLKMTNSPLVLWNYCVERRCKILSASTRDIYLLDGMVPYTKMTVQPYDISNLCLINWYD